MDEGVVEGGVDVGYAEDELALCDLWTELDGCFFLDYFAFFWCLEKVRFVSV